MDFLVTAFWFALVLSITILVHEFGHFIFAKRAGIYVYEFSLGMGPKIFSFRRKNDETLYAIRLLPIGGFVSMAGEEPINDEKVDKSKKMQSKTWMQRFSTIIAGVLFNFIFAIIILFVYALFNGSTTIKPYIHSLDSNYPVSQTKMQKDDMILKIDNKRVYTTDNFVLELQVRSGKTIILQVKHKDGSIEDVKVEPKEEIIEGTKTYKYGFMLDNKIEKGFFQAIEYAFLKFFSLVVQMFTIIIYLFTGVLSLNNLSGPVGIFNIVGSSAKAGFASIVYLMGYLSINVGFINLLPIPALDGCRLLFLIIEKIKGKPISDKVENAINVVGMGLLLLLMLVITFKDVIWLFK